MDLRKRHAELHAAIQRRGSDLLHADPQAREWHGQVLLIEEMLAEKEKPKGNPAEADQEKGKGQEEASSKPAGSP